MDDKQYYSELDRCTQRILKSKASKKIIVAGPGTGKTAFFKKIIKYQGGQKDDYLVLTFINNLEEELKKELGNIAKVFTFHGYCHYLLRRNINLGYGLQEEFEYYPPLIRLIKSDWRISHKGDEPPEFFKLMRNVLDTKELKFFLARGNYYNAVGYDDSVFRVYKSFNKGISIKERYKHIIVDEYQDFNLLETFVLSQVINYGPALVVGDDDQALYCKLRDSDPVFIRNLYNENEFEKFELPFCLRCPNAVIAVFNKVITTAIEKGFLCGRIKKEFNFFPPLKGKDSKRYPKIKLITSSIQKKTPNASNYLGKYILQEIKKIPKDEIKDSHDNKFPTVLITGPKHYLKTIVPIFDEEHYDYELGVKKQDIEVCIEDGFKILKKNERSNLGWRIVIEKYGTDFGPGIIVNSIHNNEDLINILPENFVEKILAEARSFNDEKEKVIEETREFDKTRPTIKLTTFEGAKGLSAQHVFILGMQNGELPKNPNAIADIEICKFLVALTRTRKQCYILSTTNFCGKSINPSEFVKWLGQEYTLLIKIYKTYWN